VVVVTGAVVGVVYTVVGVTPVDPELPVDPVGFDGVVVVVGAT